jgi:predicted house-cleaning noncanonical NTP pyrophosphatase (MazG superfamily)
MWQWRLVKLVRDGVQKHLPAANPEVQYRRVDDEDFIPLLIRKLGEETVEFLLDNSKEELSDVFAVCLALGDHMFNMAPDQLYEEAKRKQRRMGGFKTGMGMYIKTLTKESYDEKVAEQNEAAEPRPD